MYVYVCKRACVCVWGMKLRVFTVELRLRQAWAAGAAQEGGNSLRCVSRLSSLFHGIPGLHPSDASYDK